MLDNWQKKRLSASKQFQSLAYQEINELVFKKRTGRVITLVDDTELIEFVSCSYLGLDLDPRVIQAASAHLAQCGVTFPAARTRIEAESFIILEKLLNTIFCSGHVTIFSTLHLGHLGFIPMLGSGELPSFPARAKGFVFIVDKTVHASIQIQRALMQQFGDVIFVDFQQEAELISLFQKAARELKTPVAIADSIGSMGGVAPITRLFDLSERYQGYVYLDDAHGTSVYGKHGCGYVLDQLNHHFHPRLILASSLSKAFGAIAGVMVLPTQADADMLKRYASTYIFGGPPALSIIDSAIASAHIHLTDEITELQNKLRSNIQYFDSLLKDHVINQSTLSPIRGIHVGDEFKAIEFTKQLRKEGFAVTAAMYPTVAKHHAMLRIALSAQHTKSQIDSLCHHVQQLLTELGLNAV